MAQTAIHDGHPWRATQILAPLLRDPEKRTPAALVLAARAAAGWDGWSEVDKLLLREGWVDAQYDGEGRELLTRSALEQGNDTLALSQATRAVRDVHRGESRPVRLVLLARALERNNMFDSAAAVYARAAEQLRPVRDWLRLRAAGTQSDSMARARSLGGVTLAVARSRVPWTEAQARERFRDALGAAARYAALGATVSALRLRLSVAPDTARRDTIRAQLIQYIRGHAGTSDARAAAEVLDKGFTTLSPSEELVIARSSAVSGPWARAILGFGRALSQPTLVTPNDRLLYAQALTRVSRSRDALAQLAMVTGPLAGEAAYRRARILLTSGTGDATRAALRDVVTRFPSDTTAASASLYLLGDLSTDAGNDDQARALFQQLYHSYPTSPRADNARFQAAILSFVHGNGNTAALEFDSLVAIAPTSEEAPAARYWSGRAWAAAGDTTTARSRWRSVVSQQPTSYYAGLAAKRLNEAPWSPPASRDSFPHVPAVDSAIARVALLDQLGMDVETRFEYDALEESANRSPNRLLATAHALLEHGQPSRAIRLAQQFADAGHRDGRTYRLLYPVLDRDELTRDARAHDLDPALVAAIIRQESNFTPRATSAAGARGLMQVMPTVGAEVARALNFPIWSPALLYDPDANLQIGTTHLASYMAQYGALPRVLAAYNAGGSRITRWATKPGMDDPELFAERIPFAETRDYVRIVQRNAALYRVLYEWE